MTEPTARGGAGTDGGETLTGQLDELLERPIFGLAQAVKEPILLAALNRLGAHHRARCPAYGRIHDRLGAAAAAGSLAELLFLPVNLFKELELSSVPRAEVFRTLSSSGTGGRPSRVLVDRVTAAYQARVLAKIVASFLGRQRRPMLVVGGPQPGAERGSFSAQVAAVRGFATFGRELSYALSEDHELDLDRVEAFFAGVGGDGCFIFGFTSLVYLRLVEELRRRGRSYRLASSVLVHGGGWKTLHDRAVDDAAFKQAVADVLGIHQVHDYYGMVEQTGSVFFACERGRYHCSSFSDVLTRRADLQPCARGEVGLLQLLSILPMSYPGHSLLTEDLGVVTGWDDCPCGRLGTTFQVHGRAPEAELRGCSDVR